MGAPNPRGQKVTVPVGARQVILYVKPADMAPFLGTLTPDVASTMTSATQEVKSHTRRRYFGGPAISVEGHSRLRTKGDYKRAQTLPGNNAWLEKPSGVPGKKDVEQITYVGAFRDLKAFCKANAEIDFVLRSPWGEPFDIEAAAP